MVRIEQIIDKFNIPNKDEFEPLFDMEVEDYFLNGTLTIERDREYTIRVDNHLCIFNFDSSWGYTIDLVTDMGDGCVGDSYGVNGGTGFIS